MARRILPSQVHAFLDEYFKGREGEIRAIKSDEAMSAHAREVAGAIRFIFENAREPAVVVAALKWSMSRVPWMADAQAVGQLMDVPQSKGAN